MALAELEENQRGKRKLPPVNRKKRIILLLVAFWSVFTGASGVWLWRADCQERLNQLLLTAVKAQDSKAASLALERGADVNAHDDPKKMGWQQLLSRFPGFPPRPLRLPAYEPIQAPLPTGVGHTPLYLALYMGDEATAQMLLQHGASLWDESGRGLLFLELKGSCDVITMEHFLQRGADPNGEDAQGITLLGWAVMSGKPATVQCLLRHHADPNKESGFVYYPVDHTPLEHAERLARAAGAYPSTGPFRDMAHLLRDAGARR